MGGAVVEGDPVRAEAVGIETLTEKFGFHGGGETEGPLDLADFRFVSGPCGDGRGNFDVGEEIEVICHVRCIKRDGGDACVEKGRNFSLGYSDVFPFFMK